MKTKLALFKWITLNIVTPCEEWAEADEDKIRLTEWVEVDFPELPPEDHVKKEIEALDIRIAEVRTAAEVKIAQIERRKSELLAITYKPEKS